MLNSMKTNKINMRYCRNVTLVTPLALLRHSSPVGGVTSNGVTLGSETGGVR